MWSWELVELRRFERAERARINRMLALAVIAATPAIVRMIQRSRKGTP